MGAYAFISNWNHIEEPDESLGENEAARPVAKPSRNGVFIETPGGETVYCSKTAEVIAGYSLEDIQQYGWLNLVFPDEEQRSKAVQLTGQASSGNDFYIEAPVKRRDGSDIWISLSITPINICGKSYNLGVITDITEQIKEKEELCSAKRISNTLQEALLTVPERLPGINFEHLYQSSTEATLVGGDFYDLFELEYGRIGIVIGDVSGKGLEAAVFTAVIKNTIKAYAYENSSPASIVARTNKLMFKLSPDYVFATLFYGVLDTKTGRLNYCNAGHPPVIIKTPEPEVRLLPTISPIIGAMRDLTFLEDEIVVNSGDILIAYTDGVIEARCNGHLFSEERLISFIKDIKYPDFADLPLLIFKEIMDYTGGILSDDLAILCINLTS